MPYIVGAVLALCASQIGFWSAIWALREARGRPALGRDPDPPATAAEDLFEALLP